MIGMKSKLMCAVFAAMLSVGGGAAVAAQSGTMGPTHAQPMTQATHGEASGSMGTRHPMHHRMMNHRMMHHRMMHHRMMHHRMMHHHMMHHRMMHHRMRHAMHHAMNHDAPMAHPATTPTHR